MNSKWNKLEEHWKYYQMKHYKKGDTGQYGNDHEQDKRGVRMRAKRATGELK